MNQTAQQTKHTPGPWRIKTNAVKQNISNGRWAVAWDGYQGWRRSAAIGDGITRATMCLVTRCGSRAEAEALARALNDAQPGVLPGSQDVPTFGAYPYQKRDYMGRQAIQQNGARDCDRRILGVGDDHLHRGLIR